MLKKDKQIKIIPNTQILQKITPHYEIMKTKAKYPPPPPHTHTHPHTNKTSMQKPYINTKQTKHQ